MASDETSDKAQVITDLPEGAAPPVEENDPELEARIAEENEALHRVQREAQDRATIEYLQGQVVDLHRRNIALQKELDEANVNKKGRK